MDHFPASHTRGRAVWCVLRCWPASCLLFSLSPGSQTVHCSCWNYTSAELIICVLSSTGCLACTVPGSQFGNGPRGWGGREGVSWRVRSAFLAFCTLNVLLTKGYWRFIDSGQNHLSFPWSSNTHCTFCKVCCLAWRVQWHNNFVVNN